MVSLSRELNTSSGGGVFFDSSLSVSVGGDEDSQLLQAVVGTDVTQKFKPLDTVAVIIVELLLSVAVVVAAVVLSFVWPQEMDRCAPYFITLYIRAAFWCVSLIVHNHIRQKHHEIRVNGHLEFYQQINVHGHIPFYIVCLWNAVLLVLNTLFHHIYNDFRQQCSVSGFTKPINYLSIFIAVETAVLACVIIPYVHKTIQFNRSKPPPDIQREEWMISFIQDSYSGGEVGYRDQGDQISDLLEKQADLIRYLKDRNAKLSHKIMLLSSRMQAEQT